MDTVVVVHGLWNRGPETWFLRHRLEAEHGFRTEVYQYPSVSGSLGETVEGLRRFVRHHVGGVHLLGHSLGGMVVLHMLNTMQDVPPGRAVLLAPPARGCAAADGFLQFPWGAAALGASMREVLETEASLEAADREVGVIAGNLPLGLGRLFGSLDSEHDGTVQVKETRVPGIADHVVLPVTHTGMLFAPSVADQAGAFFRTGRFSGCDSP